MKHQNITNTATMEYRISFSRHNEQDPEYYATEEAARLRFEELSGQNIKCQVEHMDIVIGVPEYIVVSNM